MLFGLQKPPAAPIAPSPAIDRLFSADLQSLSSFLPHLITSPLTLLPAGDLPPIFSPPPFFPLTPFLFPPAGDLPPFFSSLTGLRELWLSNASSLTGSLPEEWAALTQLSALTLEGLQLSGNVPPQYAALTGLVDLSLGTNWLSGPLPSLVTGLTGLTALDLGSNR